MAANAVTAPADAGATRTSRHEKPEGAAPIRVLVADCCASTRVGVRFGLEGDGCCVCGEACDAPSAVEAAHRMEPDVCLLDTHLPGDAIAAAAQIAEELPETAVVMFSDSRDGGDVLAALVAGAAGYLLKDVDPRRLHLALRRVVEGETVLPRCLVGPLVAEVRKRERWRRLPIVRDLTNRELEVLELLREGLATSEIAERLFVAQVTVRTHVASILRKLRVPDREATRFLLEKL